MSATASVGLFSVLIFLAIVFSAVFSVILMILLVRDWLRRQLW